MSIAPLTPVDLSGPSADTQDYTQQLFAIEDGQEVPNAESWPSEALVSAWRKQALVQFVAAEVGAGPRWNPTTKLTNAQVIWAQNAYSSIAGTLGLHPAYADALERASRIAEKHGASELLPWPTPGKVWPFKRIFDAQRGSAVVSGYYGTGHGTLK